MIADAPRTSAYARAIEASVRPGDAVLEIGTGTGLFAILARRAGARRVYAIEADDIIEVARANARANGMAGDIEFFHAFSTDVELPERVDVIVSDLRGVLPFFERHFPSIVDARTRFLAPGGRLVPRADRVMAACVAAPALHANLSDPWTSRPYGADLSAGHALALNTWQKAEVEPAQVITEAVQCARIDYTTVVQPDLRARLRLRALREGEAHGLLAWFDAELTESIGFSCGPAPGRSTIYGQALFPFPRPLALEAGESVGVALDVRLVGDDYVWSWETEFRGERLRQSTFEGEPLSAARLRMRAADFTPAATEDARIDRLILDGMERGLVLGEIARTLHAGFPRRFARWEDALARAGEVTMRYAR